MTWRNMDEIVIQVAPENIRIILMRQKMYDGSSVIEILGKDNGSQILFIFSD